MTNVTALVNQSRTLVPGASDLLRIYEGYAGRSADERRRMKLQLGYIKDATLLDTRALFALPQAFTDKRVPTIAFAPYTAPAVRFSAVRDEGSFSIDVSEVDEDGDRFTRPQSFMRFQLPVKSTGVTVEIVAEPVSEPAEAEGGFFLSAFRTMRLSSWPVDYRAQVPLTPRSLLPWNPLTRKNLHVLFDADWKALPVDPYLLERKNEHQFRVVAHWDVSEQEREIMKLIGRE